MKRLFISLSILASFALLAACGSNDAVTTPDTPATPSEPSADNVAVGLDSVAMGWKLLSEEDELSLPYTCPGGGEIDAMGNYDDCKLSTSNRSLTLSEGTLSGEENSDGSKTITWDSTANAGSDAFDYDGTLTVDDPPSDADFDITLTIDDIEIGLAGTVTENDDGTLDAEVTISVGGEEFATCSADDLNVDSATDEDLLALCEFVEEDFDDSLEEVDPTCPVGNNDFFVVENDTVRDDDDDALCDNDQGKLSRVNTDVGCKEVILNGLDCPVGFFMASDTIGYLSESPRNTGEARPGNIYQVDVSEKTMTLINDGANREFEDPQYMQGAIGLDPDVVGCLDTELLLLIADTGVEQGGGQVWKWCLKPDDPVNSNGPSILVSSDEVENPVGVTLTNAGDQVVVTGFRDNDDGEREGILYLKGFDDGAGEGTILGSSLTEGLRAVSFDAANEDKILVADTDVIYRVDVEGGEGDLPIVQEGLGAAEDILFVSEGVYYISDYGNNQVVQAALDGETAATSITSGIVIGRPTGITSVPEAAE